MKLIGNSVSVPVIDIIIKSIISTGVFELKAEQNGIKKHEMLTMAICNTGESAKLKGLGIN